MAAAFRGDLTASWRTGTVSPWRSATVGDICEITSGYGFPKERQGKSKGDYPFAKVSDISKAVASAGGSLSDAVNWVD